MTVYFDNAATSPPVPEAAAAFTETAARFGNPSSLHDMGVDAEHILSDARTVIGRSLGLRAVSPTNPCVYFTSGGTEGNNLLIFGVLERYRASKRPYRVITSAAEHSSVSAALGYWEQCGAEVVGIPSPDGVFDMDAFRLAVNPDTVLVTVMAVGNETGAVNDTAAIFAAARAVNPAVICHTDATQAFMKVPLTQKSSAADLITLSAHKIGAFKGSGAVYIDPRLITAKRITPLIYGGGQEWAVRPGTENVPGIAAFAAAVKVREADFEQNRESALQLHEFIAHNLPDGVKANVPPVFSPFILSLTASGIRSEILLQYLCARKIYVSSGSACSSHSHKKVSSALTDFGLTPKDADCTIRLSFGPQNTVGDAEQFLSALRDGVSHLQKL